MEQNTLFRQIFSDAHVVDLDLSEWDKQIDFYVLADHAGRTASGRKRLFIVNFMRVERLAVEFNHLSATPPINLGEREHVQWRVDDYRIERQSGLMEISFWGLATTPCVTVTCERVDVEQASLEIADHLFPGWSRPSAGFMRPGLRSLSTATR